MGWYVYSSLKPSSPVTIQGWRAHEPRVHKPIQGISGHRTNLKSAWLALSALVFGSHVVMQSRPGYAVRWRVIYDSPQSRGASEVGIAYAKVRDGTDIRQTDRNDICQNSRRDWHTPKTSERPMPKFKAGPTCTHAEHRNTEIPKHRSTDMTKQKYRSTEHRNTEIPKHRNTETPKYRSTETPKYRNTETPKYIYFERNPLGSTELYLRIQ